MREDIASYRGDGWIRIECDAPGCTASVEARPTLGTSPEGWAEDLRRRDGRRISIPADDRPHARLLPAARGLAEA